jgi:hypothetical protein
LQYQTLRRRAIRDNFHAAFAGEFLPANAAFHNGVGVLPEILHWHNCLRQSIRGADAVTRRVLDLIENHMLLKDPCQRATTAEVIEKMKGIIREVETDLEDSPQLESNGIVERTPGLVNGKEMNQRMQETQPRGLESEKIDDTRTVNSLRTGLDEHSNCPSPFVGPLTASSETASLKVDQTPMQRNTTNLPLPEHDKMADIWKNRDIVGSSFYLALDRSSLTKILEIPNR